MKKTMMFISALMLATPIVARAMDDLMPASSEDLEQFDRAMAVHQQQQEQRVQKKDRRENRERQPKKDNFGQRVSTEAQRLKDSAGSPGDLGRFTSGQRRQDGDRQNSGAASDRGDRGDRGDRSGDSGRGGRRGGR